MRYLPELYYFQDERSVSYEKAVEVTAKAMAPWCSFYFAELLAPVKGIRQTTAEGALGADKEGQVAGLFAWLRQYSRAPGLFRLYLDAKPIDMEKDGDSMFCYPDGSCCSCLNVSEEQFYALQDVWEANGLPRDLYYEASRTVNVPGTGAISKLLRKIGIESSRGYSPKQWETLKK